LERNFPPERNGLAQRQNSYLEAIPTITSFKEKPVNKISIAVFALCAAGICAAQPAITATQTPQTSTKHFRLTFVLTYPQQDQKQAQQASQVFVLDVPVMPDHPGMSGMNLASGSVGQSEGSVQQSLQCSNVRESATGLAANVSFAMDSVPSKRIPGTTEPVHSRAAFQRQVDLELGKPMQITGELHRVPLRKGDPIPSDTPSSAPQITLTATEL
jgi:hypothetical protein